MQNAEQVKLVVKEIADQITILGQKLSGKGVDGLQILSQWHAKRSLVYFSSWLFGLAISITAFILLAKYFTKKYKENGEDTECAPCVLSIIGMVSSGVMMIVTLVNTLTSISGFVTPEYEVLLNLLGK